jgi:hypothetical protein
MTPEQFCYWLQGFVELSQEAPTPEQWDKIRQSLNATVPPMYRAPVLLPATARARVTCENSLGY